VLGAFVLLSAAIFAVLARGNISGGIVGLSLSFALQVISSYVFQLFGKHVDVFIVNYE